MDQLIIHKNKNPVLRKKCQTVEGITLEEKNIFKSMTEIMRRESGIGLAAPQVGILK